MKSPVSSVRGAKITDVAFGHISKIVQTIGVNEIAALFLFGVGIIVVAVLRSVEGGQIFSLLLLFAILLFFYRITGTKVRLEQLRIDEIRLRLRAGRSNPQLEFLMDKPPDEP